MWVAKGRTYAGRVKIMAYHPSNSPKPIFRFFCPGWPPIPLLGMLVVSKGRFAP